MARRLRFQVSMQPPIQTHPTRAGFRRLGSPTPTQAGPVAQLAALAFLTATLVALFLFTLNAGAASPLGFVWGTFGGERPADYQTSISTVAPVRASIQQAP